MHRRGLGNFSVDLKAAVNSEGVLIHNEGAERIPVAILFQNHGGKIGYQVLRSLREPVSVQFADLSGGIEPLRERLESELIEMGLYRKEAHAMLETWRDSWFEEGMRVFYILPRASVDTLLPLSIEPAPSQLARVFVGRVALLAPWMKQEIGAALASENVATLATYGRFLNAFSREMSGGGGEFALSDRARQFLQAAYTRVGAERQRASCGQ
jgi:hypothetical protein